MFKREIQSFKNREHLIRKSKVHNQLKSKLKKKRYKHNLEMLSLIKKCQPTRQFRTQKLQLAEENYESYNDESD